MQNQQQQSVYTKKVDEQILVVKKEVLFPTAVPQGVVTENLDEYYHRILQNQEFLPRSLMETDPQYKQIIPLFVFLHENKIFLMQRSNKGGDARLHERYTVGIGGHIRQEDLTGSSIQDWAWREFQEEVNYHDDYIVKPFGLLNDDSNDVGKVHTGFIFLMHGTSDRISIKSELQSGSLVTLQEALDKKERLESWSLLIVEALLAKE